MSLHEKVDSACFRASRPDGFDQKPTLGLDQVLLGARGSMLVDLSDTRSHIRDTSLRLSFAGSALATFRPDRRS
jgi:hypothetical protein